MRVLKKLGLHTDKQREQRERAWFSDRGPRNEMVMRRRMHLQHPNLVWREAQEEEKREECKQLIHAARMMGRGC